MASVTAVTWQVWPPRYTSNDLGTKLSPRRQILSRCLSGLIEEVREVGRMRAEFALGEKLTLPVPETLHAVYAVTVPQHPPDLVELVRSRMPHWTAAPLSELVLKMLDSPLLTIEVRAAAEFPPLPTEMLAAYRSPESDLARIESATHVIAVRAAHPPGRPLTHEWAARAAAGVIAAELDAPVVDVFTPRILPAAELTASLPDSAGRTRLVDWMLIPHSQGRAGLDFDTKGLARFGLPELRADGVPPELLQPWGGLFNGLARALLDRWLDELGDGALPIFVELPETFDVGTDDVAAAIGGAAERVRTVAVRLRLDDSGDASPVLAVVPGDGHADAVPRYYRTVCDQLFAGAR